MSRLCRDIVWCSKMSYRHPHGCVMTMSRHDDIAVMTLWSSRSGCAWRLSRRACAPRTGCPPSPAPTCDSRDDVSTDDVMAVFDAEKAPYIQDNIIIIIMIMIMNDTQPAYVNHNTPCTYTGMYTVMTLYTSRVHCNDRILYDVVVYTLFWSKNTMTLWWSPERCIVMIHPFKIPGTRSPL